MPQELEGELSEAGFAIEEVVGVEGPGWLLSDLPRRLDDPEQSGHFMAVGRR